MALDVRKLVNELFAKSEAKPAENKPAPPPPSAKAPPAQPIAPKAPEPAAKAPMGDAKPAEKRPEFKGADDSIYHQTQMAIKNGVPYNGSGKDSKAVKPPKTDGEKPTLVGIDCSGWVAETQRNMVKSLQSQLDDPKRFVAETRRLVTNDAAHIIDNFAKAGAPVLTGADLKKQGPREGMLIGEWNPKPPRPHNGKPRDIDHIVQTVKGPDGQIWVSESRGDRGVMLTRYHEYIAAKERAGAKLYAVDAYQHYDKMTHGQFSAIAATQKAVETAVGTPQTQQATSSSPVRSLVDAVRPTELEYVENAPPPPSADADTLAINTPPPAPATPEELHEHLQQMTP